MPRKTDFCSKWLLKFDNTGRVCSRWLTKGKTSNSFRCTACNTDDLSCANGGWRDVKKHFDRPKHIQCMKDVFGSIPLVTSSRPSSAVSSNENDCSTHTATSSTSINKTKIPFLSIQNDQRSLTHEDSKCSSLLFFFMEFCFITYIVCKKIKIYHNMIDN